MIKWCRLICERAVTIKIGVKVHFQLCNFILDNTHKHRVILEDYFGVIVYTVTRCKNTLHIE